MENRSGMSRHPSFLTVDISLLGRWLGCGLRRQGLHGNFCEDLAIGQVPQTDLLLIGMGTQGRKGKTNGN